MLFTKQLTIFSFFHQLQYKFINCILTLKIIKSQPTKDGENVLLLLCASVLPVNSLFINSLGKGMNIYLYYYYYFYFIFIL